MNAPPCNSCGGTLVGPIVSELPTDEVGSVWFDCADCDQAIGVAPSGRSWQIILPRLYPSQRSPRMEHEYAEHEGGQKVFFSTLMCVAGLRTTEAHLLYVGEVAASVRRWKDEHPLPRSLRERIRAAFA